MTLFSTVFDSYVNIFFMNWDHTQSIYRSKWHFSFFIRRQLYFLFIITLTFLEKKHEYYKQKKPFRGCVFSLGRWFTWEIVQCDYFCWLRIGRIISKSFLGPCVRCILTGKTLLVGIQKISKLAWFHLRSRISKCGILPPENQMAFLGAPFPKLNSPR